MQRRKTQCSYYYNTLKQNKSCREGKSVKPQKAKTGWKQKQSLTNVHVWGPHILQFWYHTISVSADPGHNPRINLLTVVPKRRRKVLRKLTWFVRTDLGKRTHLYDETQGTMKHKCFRQKVFVRCKKTDRSTWTPDEDSVQSTCVLFFLVFCCIGEYISLDLCHLVNLTSTRSLTWFVPGCETLTIPAASLLRRYSMKPTVRFLVWSVMSMWLMPHGTASSSV